jgi:hypothetical protein
MTVSSLAEPSESESGSEAFWGWETIGSSLLTGCLDAIEGVEIENEW